MIPRIGAGHRRFSQTDFWPQLEALAHEKMRRIFDFDKNGRAYGEILTALPKITPSTLNLDQDRVTIGAAEDIDDPAGKEISAALRSLIPWRKGPFELFGTVIDSEWVSSLKWNRLKRHITPLSGRRILDIGCSNGYYMFRMSDSQPQLILGIEPYGLFYAQFLMLQHFARRPNIFCLPAKLEELTFCGPFFDTVFCMGILYHQRSPIDTLTHIHTQMATGGELVLETLIIEGKEDISLFPAKRYAKMNNVYFIPTVTCLAHWLLRCGFTDVNCISIEKTTEKEQRKTPWIASQSLASFLDPQHPELTIEGYPAPTRAILTARAK